MEPIEKERLKFLRSALRKQSRFWTPRLDALRSSSIGGNNYVCNACRKVFNRSGVHVDHINPVVPLEGTSSIEEYINGLLCDKAGFQVICKACHKEKTNKERSLRKKKR